MHEVNNQALENITRILEGFGVNTNVETRASNLLALGSPNLVIEMLHEFYRRAKAKDSFGTPEALFCRILDDEAFCWLERRRREAEAPKNVPTTTRPQFQGPSKAASDAASLHVLALSPEELVVARAAFEAVVAEVAEEEVGALAPEEAIRHLDRAAPVEDVAALAADELGAAEALWNMAKELERIELPHQEQARRQEILDDPLCRSTRGAMGLPLDRFLTEEEITSKHRIAPAPQKAPANRRGAGSGLPRARKS